MHECVDFHRKSAIHTTLDMQFSRWTQVNQTKFETSSLKKTETSQIDVRNVWDAEWQGFSKKSPWQVDDAIIIE